MAYEEGGPAKEILPAVKCLVGASRGSHEITYLLQGHQHLSWSTKIIMESLDRTARRFYDAVDFPASWQQTRCSAALAASARPGGWKSNEPPSSPCMESRRGRLDDALSANPDLC